jgi:hypothetical protein
MLGHPYRLLLRGMEKKAGRISKAVLPQIVPQTGNYPVIFEGTAGIRKGAVDMDAYGISWHYDGDVEAITFV